MDRVRIELPNLFEHESPIGLAQIAKFEPLYLIAMTIPARKA